MNSIGAALNVYNDNLALPGWLEMASSFYDSILVIHAGPNGRKSTDGTIETLERWGVRVIFDSIDKGFGVIRSRLVHDSDTTWVHIMDADERFYPKAPMLHCHGTEAYPQVQKPDVKCSHHGMYDQGAVLRNIIQTDIRAVKTVRRHWFKFGFSHPTQNWEQIPDYQLRIVKNDKDIRYDANIPMHEKIQDAQNGNGEPRCSMWNPDDMQGIFHDHYHCFFKAQEPDQRREDIKIFDAIHSGTQEKTWKELGYL